MACMFTILGENLNIDLLIQNSKLKGFKKYYKGDEFGRNKLRKNSFASRCVSNSDNLKIQIDAATKFLKANGMKLRSVKDMDGIQYATFDFGTACSMNNGFVESFYLPPEFVGMCGELNIGIELSIYNQSAIQDL